MYCDTICLLFYLSTKVSVVCWMSTVARDALSPIEREALNAVRHQRRMAAAAAASTATSSGVGPDRLMLGQFRSFTAEDVSLRRGIDRVLEREVQLLEIRLQHKSEDLDELRRKAFALELKRDRLSHILQVIIPDKKASANNLRSSIGFIEESRLGKLQDKKMLHLAGAFRQMVAAQDDLSGVVPFAAKAWLSTDRTATATRESLASMLSSTQTSLVEGPGGSHHPNSSLSPIQDEVETTRAAIRRETLRREIRDMFDACVESSTPRQASSWYRIASDTVALQTKLRMDKEDLPKYDAMNATLHREIASRVSLREEQDRQLQDAHDRLEEAHKAAFQNRKNMISLHRRLTQDRSNGASNSKAILESIRNELAMGKVDLLRSLCNEEARNNNNNNNTSTVLSAAGQLAATPLDGPQGVGRAAATTATSAAGPTHRRANVAPSTGDHFASGTFTPTW